MAGYNENIGTEVKIQARDSLGRFMKVLDADAVETARELTDRAVELAKQNARPFRKTGRLEAGIVPEYRGKVGYVRSTAAHAHPVEKGSIAHQIPGAFGKQAGITHPGNKAQPYLDQVPRQLLHEAEQIARDNYDSDPMGGDVGFGADAFGDEV